MIKAGYKKLFDAICSVLDIYDPGDSDVKFNGLLSRVRRSIKNGEIDFSYSTKGNRYIHVNQLKKWSGSYIVEFPLIEAGERKKLENLKTQNKNIMERIEIENTADLVSKAKKYVHETEAKKRAAEITNKKKKESRDHCIETASDLWKGSYDNVDQDHKIKEMCDVLMTELKVYPEMYQPKSIKTIRKWLKDAEKNGELNIPEAAKKPGRPKK